MECSKIQIDLLNGIANPEIEEHISECAECKVFQDSLEQFLAARPDIEKYDPSEKLDFEVKKEARIFIEKHMKAYNASASTQASPIPKLISYFAAASCTVLVVWLFVLTLKHEPLKTQAVKTPVSDPKISFIASNGDQYEPVTWENVSMDEDFFSVITDIELSFVLLTTPFTEEEEFKLPDEG